CAMAIGLGLRLSHSDNASPGSNLPQFTIRQLIVVTAVVGIFFGIGRIAVPMLQHIPWSARGLLVLASFGAMKMMLTLPLILAPLLRRFTFPAVLLAIIV